MTDDAAKKPRKGKGLATTAKAVAKGSLDAGEKTLVAHVTAEYGPEAGLAAAGLTSGAKSLVVRLAEHLNTLWKRPRKSGAPIDTANFAAAAIDASELLEHQEELEAALEELEAEQGTAAAVAAGLAGYHWWRDANRTAATRKKRRVTRAAFVGGLDVEAQRAGEVAHFREMAKRLDHPEIAFLAEWIGQGIDTAPPSEHRYDEHRLGGYAHEMIMRLAQERLAVGGTTLVEIACGRNIGIVRVANMGRRFHAFLERGGLFSGDT